MATETTAKIRGLTRSLKLNSVAYAILVKAVETRTISTSEIAQMTPGGSGAIANKRLRSALKGLTNFFQEEEITILTGKEDVELRRKQQKLPKKRGRRAAPVSLDDLSGDEGDGLDEELLNECIEFLEEEEGL